MTAFPSGGPADAATASGAAAAASAGAARPPAPTQGTRSRGAPAQAGAALLSSEERMEMTQRDAAADLRPQTSRAPAWTVGGERPDQRSLLQARLVRARLSAHAEVQKETKRFLASVVRDVRDTLEALTTCAHTATAAYIEHLRRSEGALLRSDGGGDGGRDASNAEEDSEDDEFVPAQAPPPSKRRRG